MNFFSYHKRINSLLTGILAAVMISLSFAGCGDKTVVNAPSSQSAASSVQSSASLQTSSAGTSSVAASSAASSAAASSVASSAKATSSAAKASSVAAIKPAKKAVVKATTPVSAVAETGNKAIKKIAVDQSTQKSTQLSVDTSAAVAKKGYTYVYQRAGYNYIPDVLSRNVYKGILVSVYKVAVTPNSQGYYPTQKITITDAHLTEANLRVILLAFINDNPQVFWLANAYSYGYSEDGKDTIIQLYSAISQTECNTMIKQLDQKVDAATSAMPLGLSEIDRELYLFQYLAKNCVYDYDAKTDNGEWKPFSAYGALVEGKAVCEGYSRAMQLLSSYAGLESALITGQSDGVNHMWNLMKINGDWYHLDTTWCDSDVPVYNFFNLNDTVITQTRSIFPSASTLTANQIDGSDGAASQCNLSIPSCTATDQNYYKAKGIPIGTLDGTQDSGIITAISAAAKAKSDSISFYVTDSADFDQILSGLVSGAPYKIVSYINAVNSESGMTNQIDLSKIKYISDPANRGIAIYLSYK